MSDHVSRHQFESMVEYRVYNVEKIIDSLRDCFCAILGETVEAKLKAERESPTFPASVKTSLLNGSIVNLTDVIKAFQENLEKRDGTDLDKVKEAVSTVLNAGTEKAAQEATEAPKEFPLDPTK